MIDRIVLVDGTYELFRSWFGAPPRQAPDGREIGASRGVVLSLFAMLRDEGVRHVAVATDSVVRSFRNDLYAGYKTEEGVQQELLSQFPLLDEWLKAAGFVVWPMVEFEADDALASGALRFADHAKQIIVATVDKDLAQCVRGQHVIMQDRRRKTTTDEAGVVEKFGVPPHAIADLLALVGDSADGYPGIRGFGMKSAAACLNAFGSIEAIPDDAAKYPKGVRGAARLAETLAASREEAMLFKKLATLRLDVPITESAAALCWQGPSPRFDSMCRELGCLDMLDRVPSL